MNSTIPNLPPTQHAAGATYTGPARVLAVNDQMVQLECPDSLPWARMAIAPRYEPEIGDEVLVTGTTDGGWFVIGVLSGRGRTRIESLGDLTLAAPGGKIEIMSSENVQITAPKMRFVAHEIETVAKTLLQRATSFTQWVTDALHQKLGRLVTKVEGSCHLKAERISQRADEDVKVNGRTIHLN